MFYLFRKLAKEEMEDMVKTNIVETEKFTLPSGQEIEKENILALIDSY